MAGFMYVVKRWDWWFPREFLELVGHPLLDRIVREEVVGFNGVLGIVVFDNVFGKILVLTIGFGVR